MREGFHDELGRLDAAVVAMGGDALRAVELAVVVLDRFDTEAVATVVTADSRIRGAYQDLEHEIEIVIARQAPVATDLRQCLSLLAVARHVERIGRNAARVAELAAPRRGLAGEESIADHLRTMGARAETMCEAAVDCFHDRDVEKAGQLAQLVDLMDDESGRLADAVITNASRTELRPWALRMLIAARWLQRIADHSVAIGERTIYLATGERRELGSS